MRQTYLSQNPVWLSDIFGREVHVSESATKEGKDNDHVYLSCVTLNDDNVFVRIMRLWNIRSGSVGYCVSETKTFPRHKPCY